MATRKALLQFEENNYIDYEMILRCPPSLLCSQMSKLQEEAIIETAQVYEDIVDEIPVPFPAHWQGFRLIPMSVH